MLGLSAATGDDDAGFENSLTSLLGRGGYGYEYGPSLGYHRNDERDEERAFREELRLGQEEEDQQIREAVATLEAAALLNSLLHEDQRSSRDSSRRNILANIPTPINPVGYSMSEAQLLDNAPRSPLSEQQQQQQLIFPLKDEQEGQQLLQEALYNYPNLPGYSSVSLDPAVARLLKDQEGEDDDDRLYTEGGLVFLKTPQRDLLLQRKQAQEEFYPQQQPVVGNEVNGLNFLKRYIDQPREFDGEDDINDDGRGGGGWGGPMQLEQDQDGTLIAPGGNEGIGFGSEFPDDAYGYDFDSPLFLLNRRSRNGFGFERRERLDVKKPGPWYRTVNNYAFDKDDNRNQKVDNMLFFT
jgi:hypothetical protein